MVQTDNEKMNFEAIAGLFFNILFFGWLIPDDATWTAMFIPVFWFVVLTCFLSEKLNSTFTDKGGHWKARTESLNGISPRRLTDGVTAGAVKPNLTTSARHSTQGWDHADTVVTHDKRHE